MVLTGYSNWLTCSAWLQCGCWWEWELEWAVAGLPCSLRLSSLEWLMSSHQAVLGDDGIALNVDSHKHRGPSLILRGSFVYLALHKLFWWIGRPLTLCDDGCCCGGKWSQRAFLFGRRPRLLLHHGRFFSPWCIWPAVVHTGEDDQYSNNNTTNNSTTTTSTSSTIRTRITSNNDNTIAAIRKKRMFFITFNNKPFPSWLWWGCSLACLREQGAECRHYDSLQVRRMEGNPRCSIT